MTPLKSVAIVLAGGLVAAGYFLRPVESIKFQNRMAVRETGLKRLLYRAPGRKEKAANTKSINESLLVRSLSVVDNPAAMGVGFTFPEIAAKAFAKAGITDPQTIDTKFQEWTDQPGELAVFSQIKAAWGTGGTRTVANLPLRLLAVVNRLDLAVVGCEGIDGCQKPGKPPCTAEHVCGAEVRFVYAGVNSSNAPFFTLIMEFTFESLTKQDILNLANQWAGLETIANPETPAFAAKLGDVLRFGWGLPGGIVARMRINAMTNGGGEWKLRQYSFTSSGITKAPLFQQFQNLVQAAVTCQSQGPLFDFATAAGNHAAILEGIYEVPGEHSGYNLTLPAGNIGKGVLTLATVQPQIPDLDKVRHNLSLNSCSGCHGWETRKVVAHQSALALAPFDQIQYRKVGARSQISAFLAGTKTGGLSLEPTMDTFDMKPPVLSDAQCTTTAGAVSYNDLLRRKAFVTALLGLNSNQHDGEWSKALADAGVKATD